MLAASISSDFKKKAWKRRVFSQFIDDSHGTKACRHIMYY